MNTLATARLQVRGLLNEIEAERGGVRIASLTAAQAQDIRVSMMLKLGEVLDELLTVRSAKELAAEGQMHVYHALAALTRVREMLLANASLDEIQAMLEEADAELSQAQPPTPAGRAKTSSKRE